ncbi:kinase-like domain-containing protein [Coprinopsis sp. MPI-PUGE-AT-0042]|nr:kinase-like domain-containing protein [Coprinopsis sp. MPI-PUGE-AT-0042]
MSTYPAQPTVFFSPSSLPIGSSAFFDNWARSEPLPTPSQVRSHSTGYAERLLSTGPDCGLTHDQTIFYYEELGLVIKCGRRTTVAEGQTLWLIREHCPEISHLVPEVYGWDTEGDEVFMYLSYVPGDTLHSRMENLSEQDLDVIAKQVQSITSSWRRLCLPADDIFIGTPDRKHIRDQMWWNRGHEALLDESSAFPSVAEFNSSFHDLGRDLADLLGEDYTRIRAAFPDSCHVCLTHTDLAPCNIIISPTSPEVVGIIDWQESGWYPEFWEYLKLRYHALGKWIEPTDRHFGTVYCQEWDAFHTLCSTGIF